MLQAYDLDCGCSWDQGTWFPCEACRVIHDARLHGPCRCGPCAADRGEAPPPATPCPNCGYPDLEIDGVGRCPSCDEVVTEADLAGVPADGPPYDAATRTGMYDAW